MKSISLVCTVHEEDGHASVSGLSAILERIRPEVVFLETPPSALDQYLNARTTNELESTAVGRYHARNSVELVPVDLPTPDASFFRDIRDLQERVRGRNPDFRRLLIWDRNYVRDYGFAYLNSEHCSKMWSELYAAMRAEIEALKDQRLAEVFELWNRTNELRENEMLKNILAYCDEHSFKQGAFLIGAAHRQSIIDKATELSGRSKDVQWEFSCVTDGANQNP